MACVWIAARSLTAHNKPCDVNMYGLSGRRVGVKISLWCAHCKINYNYDNMVRGQEDSPLRKSADH